MSAARHLTRAQLRSLEAELRSERARFERSLATEMGGDDAAPKTGSVLRGGAQAKRGLAAVLETRISDRHRMIDSALERLEAGTYGDCVNCHNPIPYGRLLVMPEATYCLGCGSFAA